MSKPRITVTMFGTRLSYCSASVVLLLSLATPVILGSICGCRRTVYGLHQFTQRLVMTIYYIIHGSSRQRLYHHYTKASLVPI